MLAQFKRYSSLSNNFTVCFTQGKSEKMQTNQSVINLITLFGYRENARKTKTKTNKKEFWILHFSVINQNPIIFLNIYSKKILLEANQTIKQLTWAKLYTHGQNQIQEISKFQFSFFPLDFWASKQDFILKPLIWLRSYFSATERS